MSLPGSEPSGAEKRRRAWRNALIYFGLAEDPNNPDAPPASMAGRPAPPAADDAAFARLERKIDAQSEEIAALRVEVERLGRRGW